MKQKINYNNVMVEMRYKEYLFIMTTVINVVHSTVKSRILYSIKIHIIMVQTNSITHFFLGLEDYVT